MKRKPTGFVARCQCDVYVGALDLARSDRDDVGKLLAGWLSDGCTVEPRFEHTWQITIEPCKCKEKQG